MSVELIATSQSDYKLSLPYYFNKVSAGFPSPAEDYLDPAMDLNEHLIKHPAATFFMRFTGNAMQDTGIFSGDLLIVDRSLDAIDGSVVIAIINGDFAVRRFRKKNGIISLVSENNAHKTIVLDQDNQEYEIWGVITNIVRNLVA